MIFTHKDTDGFVSGTLFYNFCKKKKANADVRIIDYGAAKISDTNLENFNKILISDLGPGAVAEDLFKLKDKKILYTDHHPEEKAFLVPEFVLELRITSEGYIPSSRTCFELTEKENKNLYWLSAIGVISDMGQLHEINNKFLGDLYKKQKTNFENMNKLSYKINDVIIYFSASIESFWKVQGLENMEDISNLDKYYDPVEKEFERLEKEYLKEKVESDGIVYFYLESKYRMIKSALSTSISGTDKSKVFIFASPKRDNLIGLSGRNQSGEYDVSNIMKHCTDGLKDAFTGGHKSAAGGQLDKSDLTKFVDRLKEIKLEGYRIK
jgi:single-stranded DNA-specific DHH superfamily exonuclease